MGRDSSATRPEVIFHRQGVLRMLDPADLPHGVAWRTHVRKIWRRAENVSSNRYCFEQIRQMFPSYEYTLKAECMRKYSSEIYKERVLTFLSIHTCVLVDRAKAEWLLVLQNLPSIKVVLPFSVSFFFLYLIPSLRLLIGLLLPSFRLLIDLLFPFVADVYIFEKFEFRHSLQCCVYYFSSVMSWTKDHDLILCRKVANANPYMTKKGSTRRSSIWEQIADTLNNCSVPKVFVDKRSVRHHVVILVSRHKKKLRDEGKASGITPDEPSA